MMKKFVLISLLMTLSFFSNSQSIHFDNDTVYWDSHRRLTWSDFKCKPSGNDLTAYGFQATAGSLVFVDTARIPNESGGVVSYSCFIKSKSWTKDTTSSDLLAHEQLHFDIAELYARKIRKEIWLLRQQNVDTDLHKQKIGELLDEFYLTSNEYDRETANGVILFKQQEWNKKIEKGLSDMESYAVNYYDYLKNK